MKYTPEEKAERARIGRALKRSENILKKSPRWTLYDAILNTEEFFDSFVDECVDEVPLEVVEEGKCCRWCCDVTYEESPGWECGGCQGRLVRFTAVGSIGFHRHISTECDLCVNIRGGEDVGGDRRGGAVISACDEADEYRKSAVACCKPFGLDWLADRLFKDWRDGGFLYKKDLLWLARIVGATPKEARALLRLRPKLTSGPFSGQNWYDGVDDESLWVLESWDDFTVSGTKSPAPPEPVDEGVSTAEEDTPDLTAEGGPPIPSVELPARPTKEQRIAQARVEDPAAVRIALEAEGLVTPAGGQPASQEPSPCQGEVLEFIDRLIGSRGLIPVSPRNDLGIIPRDRPTEE